MSLRSLMVPSALSCLLLSAAAARAEAKKYSMKDLEALDKQGAHEELLAHVEDVAPSARNKQWNALLERAATGMLEVRGQSKDGWMALALAGELPKRYPSLRRSSAYNAKRKEVILKHADTCFKSSYQGQECLDALTETRKDLAGDRDFAMKAGYVVVTNQNHYVAVPFYAEAVAGTKGESCGNPELKRAIMAGLGLPPDYDNFKLAKKTIEAPCFDAFKESIQGEIVANPSGYSATNGCAILKAKNALGSAAKACAGK